MSSKSPSEVPYQNIWKLRTDNMVKGHSWHWWWWIFFIKNPSNPQRPKQLMILWSSKYTDRIKVDDRWWSLDQIPTYENGKLKFNGMAAAWYFDGNKMHDPLFLKEGDFEVEKNGNSGQLIPHIDGCDYTFSGSSNKYKVKIQDEKNDMVFRLTPWNPYMQNHRFNENDYFKDYNYNILKIHGMKLDGRIDGKEVEGSGYFQRVSVNAPAMPWYWGLMHSESGCFLQYFNPFIGPQIFRNKPTQRSYLNWGDLSLSKSLTFYHRGTDTEYKFGRRDVKIEQVRSNKLPIFRVTGEDKNKKLTIQLEAYSRAYWRFKQPSRYMMKSIFYYNEYPANVTDFNFSLKDGSLKLKKDDIGKTYSNFEHSWGKLL